ncbi:MAG: YhcH/YjgK/YiaL family protein [Phocaeicola sp.]
MIVDTLENLKRYRSINPLFTQAIDFLMSTDLASYDQGKIELEADKLFAIFAEMEPKKQEDAKLETHNKFIDIQIPLSGVEYMGYTPRALLKEESYDEERDITFYPGLADNYIAVKPGMFILFFPEDAHAPGITPDGVRKVIIKIKA